MSDFSFVVVTDTHVDVREKREDGFWWNRMLVTRAQEILSEAVGEINRRAPDFVVHCGDLTNASDEASFREAARIAGDLEMPFHFIPGNHDTYDDGSRQVSARLFGLDDGLFYGAERFAGWRLIFLDSVYWLHKDGSVREDFSRNDFVDIDIPEEELDWLRSELAEDDETPALCFTHTMTALRDSYAISRLPGGEEITQRPVNMGKWLFPTRKLRPLLSKARSVKAVFCGHGHWHDCVVEEGTRHCQTAALVEYPCEMRMVHVRGEVIETEVFGLSGKDYGEDSYVEEWGNRWVGGQEEDRGVKHVSGARDRKSSLPPTAG